MIDPYAPCARHDTWPDLRGWTNVQDPDPGHPWYVGALPGTWGLCPEADRALRGYPAVDLYDKGGLAKNMTQEVRPATWCSRVSSALLTVACYRRA